MSDIFRARQEMLTPEQTAAALARGSYPRDANPRDFNYVGVLDPEPAEKHTLYPIPPTISLPTIALPGEEDTYVDHLAINPDTGTAVSIGRQAYVETGELSAQDERITRPRAFAGEITDQPVIAQEAKLGPRNMISWGTTIVSDSALGPNVMTEPRVLIDGSYVAITTEEDVLPPINEPRVTRLGDSAQIHNADIGPGSDLGAATRVVNSVLTGKLGDDSTAKSSAIYGANTGPGASIRYSRLGAEASAYEPDQVIVGMASVIDDSRLAVGTRIGDSALANNLETLGPVSVGDSARLINVNLEHGSDLPNRAVVTNTNIGHDVIFGDGINIQGDSLDKPIHIGNYAYLAGDNTLSGTTQLDNGQTPRGTYAGPEIMREVNLHNTRVEAGASVGRSLTDSTVAFLAKIGFTRHGEEAASIVAAEDVTVFGDVKFEAASSVHIGSSAVIGHGAIIKTDVPNEAFILPRATHDKELPS
jgi:NDP-sugar pyrophosphorylase family protein